jgi:stringent starvation protein B
MTMTPSRPYLIRALYEWILENECTPYIMVNAFEDGVEVPQEHVKDGQIILNISPNAVQNLSIRNEAIDFDGRFGGIPKKVYVPVGAVTVIYAKENGQGMVFDGEGDIPTPPLPSGPDDPEIKPGGRRKGPSSKKSVLRLVK